MHRIYTNIESYFVTYATESYEVNFFLSYINSENSVTLIDLYVRSALSRIPEISRNEWTFVIKQN